MTGTDLSLIAEEMKKAQEVLKKIQEMKSGVITMGDKRVAVQTGASSTMSTVSIIVSHYFQGEFLQDYCIVERHSELHHII